MLKISKFFLENNLDLQERELRLIHVFHKLYK